MTATAYVFYISLLGMLGMLSIKMFELKRRRRSLVYHIFVRFDKATHGMLARIFGTLRTKKGELEIFLKEDLRRLIYQAIVSSIAHAREAYDRIRASSRGVVKLRENPKVSAFLKDIEIAKKEISLRGSGPGTTVIPPP